MTRHLLLAATLAFGVALGPFAFGYARHELGAGAELEALGRRLPDRTALLDSDTDVGRSETGCRLLVAKVFATELTPKDVAEFIAENDGGSAGATFVAWAEPGAFRSQRVDAPNASTAETLPSTVEHLLSRWMALPAGVRRIVLYRTRHLATGADPRCF
jgi:hypothetical protein